MIGVQCKENFSDNFLVTFWHFYTAQFTSVQFNLLHVPKFDSLQVKCNLILCKISFVCKSLQKLPNILANLSYYKIFINTWLLPSMLALGKKWLECTVFAAKTYHCMDYSFKIWSNKNKKWNTIHKRIKTINSDPQ